MYFGVPSRPALIAAGSPEARHDPLQGSLFTRYIFLKSLGWFPYLVKDVEVTAGASSIESSATSLLSDRSEVENGSLIAQEDEWRSSEERR